MPPTLAVIAYPTLAEADLALIQSVRAQHDPQFGMLGPHFTLVFPVEAAVDGLAAEVASAARALAAFPFELRSVLAVRDIVGAGGHVLLAPEQGADQVTALHARLYGGCLRWACRADIPFVPHITVAGFAEFDRCEDLAKELRKAPWHVPGRVETLTVVHVAGSTVATLAESRLAQEGGPL